MIVGHVQRLLLAIIILDIPFPLDIHLGYRDDAANFGAVEGLNVSVTTISLIVLYALWLGELLSKQGPRPRLQLRENLPFVLYCAFTALSVLVAYDVTLSVFEIFLLLQMLLLYIYIASIVRTRQDVLFIVTMLLIGLVLESAIIIWVWLTGQHITIAAITTRLDPSHSSDLLARSGGTVGSPNTAGGYLGMLLAPAVSVLLTRLGRWYKWLAALAFCLGTVALISTFSRGGWAAFAVSLTILCLSAWRRGRLSLTVPFAIVVAGGFIFVFFQHAFVTRLLEYNNDAAYSRIPLMKLAFLMIKDNPLLGVGANNFAAVMNQYVTPELSYEWLYTVHNKYLLIWSEAGTGALVAFLWFLVATIRWGWQCGQSRDRLLSVLALGTTAGIMGHMVHMFVEIFNDRSLIQLLLLIAGLSTAMNKVDSQRIRV